MLYKQQFNKPIYLNLDVQELNFKKMLGNICHAYDI